MKKLILIIASVFAIGGAHAQLVVNRYGNVGIKCSSPLFTPLKIEGENGTYSAAIHPSKGGGLSIRTRTGGGTSRKGLYIFTDLANDTTTHGIFVSQSGNTNQNTYGIQSNAGRSTKASYGVLGSFSNTSTGTGNGAGIYGSTISAGGFAFPGQYAGYFKGDVRVTGTLYGTLLTPSEASAPTAKSDMVQSVNVSNIEDESVSDKLQQVQLLQFFRPSDANKLTAEEIQEQKEFLMAEKASTDTEVLDEEKIEVSDEIPQTKLATIKYGLAADQLKSVYPELVYEDDHGNVSINYIEMIPLLVQSINELNAKVKTLESEGDNTVVLSKSRSETTTGIDETSANSSFSMSQNKPNPFKESTTITLSVPETTHTAHLYIYDMSGKQIRQIDIEERGETSLTITSEGLTAGMYLYAFIADGKVISTKKMILL